MKIAIAVICISVAYMLGHFQGAEQAATTAARAQKETKEARLNCWRQTPTAEGCLTADAFVIQK